MFDDSIPSTVSRCIAEYAWNKGMKRSSYNLNITCISVTSNRKEIKSVTKCLCITFYFVNARVVVMHMIHCTRVVTGLAQIVYGQGILVAK